MIDRTLLQADLAEQERSKRLGLRTWVDWLEVWGMRIVINTLVFILLCGSLALIGLTTSKMIDVSVTKYSGELCVYKVSVQHHLFVSCFKLRPGPESTLILCILVFCRKAMGPRVVPATHSSTSLYHT